MSLSQAISAALSGLRVTQAGVGLVADNVANAETPGFVRKSLLQTATASGGSGGVRVVGIVRELDLFIQRQLRAELAGASYANSLSNYYARVDQIYGRPGGLNALDTLFNNFSNSLRSLATSPESIANRTQVLNEASVLAQHLNAMAGDVQQLRSQAEIAIGSAVRRVNEILQSIEQISNQIVASSPNGQETAALFDQRDNLVSELSTLLDIRVVDIGRGQISIFTNSGVSLFDNKAARLSFDGRDRLDAQSLWSADPNLRNLGTIKLLSSNGYDVDLIADKAIRSGEIAAHLEMRDRLMVEAQAQLDEIAHVLALALSERTVTGTAVAGGPPDGFNLDLSALQNGNSISLIYTDGTGTHKVTIVRVDDTGALPLANSYTTDPDDRVIGVDFSGGLAAVANALNAALGAAGLTFDSPSANVLRVLDDGVPDLVDIDGFSATVTTSTFASGDPTLPFFVDGASGSFYTAFLTAGGAQKLGFSARIALNAALKDDPSRLVVYGVGTLAGDPTRPDFLDRRLTSAIRKFAPATGIGTVDGPYSGTLVDFIRQAVSMQGAAAENSVRLKEGQDIVVNALHARLAERSSVNIDSEMAKLLALQTAYGANARVLTAVQAMIEALLRM